MRLQSILVVAISGIPTLAQSPVPIAFERDGYPVFISESEIAAALASVEGFRFEESYSALPRQKRNVMAALDAQLSGLSPEGGNRCSPFEVQPPSVDEVQPRSVVRRVHYFPASFIGTVERLTAGWASSFAAAAQLATIAVQVRINSGPYTLEVGERIHVIVPYGSFEVRGGTLCTDRGYWPRIEVGSRLLVNGYWEKLAPDAVVIPVDLAVIENGSFLPSDLPNLDLTTVASELDLLERMGRPPGLKP